MDRPTTVRCKDLWFSYPGRSAVLHGISLQVPEGAFWAIFGPSGAGKTTLMKCLAGLLKPQRGRIELLGHAVNGNGLPGWLRLKVGYIPQQLGLVRGLTALENVLLGSLGRNGGWGNLLGAFPKEEVERAREYLALLGIGQKAREKAYRLSGGERQRVAIARTLLQGPRIIFADEFVSDLDLPRAVQILTTLRELGQRQRLTFVMNLHEVEVTHQVADQALVLKDGNLVYQGPARELSTAELLTILQ
ncbi:MAG: ATP-binding cassette domain-containing protein [Firmicutes bacterium]|nr:ATP-binding cassette domain-containing protein [Bacillota bacterium]